MVVLLLCFKSTFKKIFDNTNFFNVIHILLLFSIFLYDNSYDFQITKPQYGTKFKVM